MKSLLNILFFVSLFLFYSTKEIHNQANYIYDCFYISNLNNVGIYLVSLNEKLSLSDQPQLWCFDKDSNMNLRLRNAVTNKFLYTNCACEDGTTKFVTSNELTENSKSFWLYEQISVDSSKPKYTIIRSKNNKDYFLTSSINNKDVIFKRFGGAGFLRQGWIFININS